MTVGTYSTALCKLPTQLANDNKKCKTPPPSNLFTPPYSHTCCKQPEKDRHVVLVDK